MKMLSLLLLCLLLISCHPGDHKAPGVPPLFQFLCDATTMASTCLEPNTRLLTWTDTGDDGKKGRATQYDLRWSFYPMNKDIYRVSFPVTSQPIPQKAGSREQIFLPRMFAGRYLSFGMMALDEVANKSGLATASFAQLNFIRTPLGAGGVTAPDFGTAAEPVGLLNYQGVNVLAVGAPDAINPMTSQKTGAVFLYFNAISTNLMTYQNGFLRTAIFLNPSIIIFGQTSGERFGESISGEGDFNADGIPDLVVGAPGAGKVYVFNGGLGGQAQFYLWPPNPIVPGYLDASKADISITSGITGFGSSVALLGDLNNRPASELLIGSPSESRAYLFYGGLITGNAISGLPPINFDMTTGWADWTIIGDAESDFGKVVARAADINGDGIEDMIITAPSLDYVYVFLGGAWSGKAIDFSLMGPQLLNVSTPQWDLWDLLIKGEPGTNFGAAVSARRSLTPSYGFFTSIAVGAPQGDKAYVFYGSPGIAIRFPQLPNSIFDVTTGGADQIFNGDPSTSFGAAISGRSDLNGDGYADLLIGAPDAPSLFLGNVGAVYQYITSPYKPAIQNTITADFIIWGLVDKGRFGASVEGVSGMASHPPVYWVSYYDDFIAGAPGAGAAYAEY